MPSKRSAGAFGTSLLKSISVISEPFVVCCVVCDIHTRALNVHKSLVPIMVDVWYVCSGQVINCKNCECHGGSRLQALQRPADSPASAYPWSHPGADGGRAWRIDQLPEPHGTQPAAGDGAGPVAPRRDLRRRPQDL